MLNVKYLFNSCLFSTILFLVKNYLVWELVEILFENIIFRRKIYSSFCVNFVMKIRKIEGSKFGK